MAERRPKMGDGLPNRVVHEHGAAGDALMQLRRDIAGLLLHPIGVRFPSLEKGWNVCFRDLEDVYQDHR